VVQSECRVPRPLGAPLANAKERAHHSHELFRLRVVCGVRCARERGHDHVLTIFEARRDMSIVAARTDPARAVHLDRA